MARSKAERGLERGNTKERRKKRLVGELLREKRKGKKGWFCLWRGCHEVEEEKGTCFLYLGVLKFRAERKVREGNLGGFCFRLATRERVGRELEGR